MYFNEASRYFCLIEKASRRLEITHILADLFKETNPQEIEILSHLVLGQLKPPHKGTQINIAEKNMIKVVAGVLGQPEDVIKKSLQAVGDLGSVLEKGSSQNYGQKSIFDMGEPKGAAVGLCNNVAENDLLVEHVYKKLCEVESITGVGSQDAKIIALTELLKKASPLSAKYIVRIVMGKLRLGFSAMTLIEALSWMITGDKSLRPIIENAYNLCADMGFIARQLKEGGIEALKDMKMHVGVPVLPAAAERLATPKVHFFSRNLSDMSAMFPDLVHVLEKIPVQTLICEGEAIVYDQHAGSFVPFQETVKRRRKHGIEKAAEELPLKIFLFDLLYLNGVSYLDTSHTKRRQALLSIFKDFKSSTVQPIAEKEIYSVQDLEHYFNENIAAGLEGLVVKKNDSIYQPGKRNFNWIKLKRQQAGHLSDTLDGVILGYYYGSGRRAQFGIGAFLVGVYNKEKDMFQTVAKVGTGLSDADWRELKQKCDVLQVNHKPKNIECSPQLHPDVWVSPEIVCVIRADEITFSPIHSAGKVDKKTGYAMRFPRFMGYRPDKSAHEATTTTELVQMYSNQPELCRYLLFCLQCIKKLSMH